MSQQHSVGDMIAANARAVAVADADTPSWDITFATDIQKRYQQYGRNTFLSDKQLKHIQRIFNERGHNCLEEDDDTPF